MPVALATALSRVTGFGRVLALAYALSFTRLTDAYNLANTTPNIVYELVLGGVLAATLVPVFVERLERDDTDSASEAISAVCTLALVVGVALAALLAVGAPQIIAVYTARAGRAAGAQREVAASLLRLFAPQIALYCFAAVAGAVLTARRRFLAPMTTPILNNLVVIGVLLAVPRLFEELSLAAARGNPRLVAMLGIGTTAGVALQAVGLLPAVRAANVHLRPVWRPSHPAVRQVLRLSGWTAAYVVTNQVTLWVVLVVANTRAGDVSAYQAAYLFFQLPFAVVAVTVMTVRLPDLSARWSSADVAGFRASLGAGTRVIVFLLVPAAVGYVFLAGPLVRMLLEHGAMSASSAGATGDILAMFAVGLPAFGVYLFFMVAFQAMQDTRAMFAIYCVENGINVVLALGLHAVLGAPGLGLAFALAYVGGTAVAAIVLRRRLAGGLGVTGALRATMVPAVALTVPVAVGARLVADARGIELVVELGAVVAVAAVVYLATAARSGELARTLDAARSA